jgi:chromosome segregation ATPase
VVSFTKPLRHYLFIILIDFDDLDYRVKYRIDQFIQTVIEWQGTITGQSEVRDREIVGLRREIDSLYHRLDAAEALLKKQVVEPAQGKKLCSPPYQY